MFSFTKPSSKQQQQSLNLIMRSFNTRTCVIFCLLLNALVVVPIALSQNINGPGDLTTNINMIMQEAFQYSNMVRSTMDIYIREALPLEARADANKILQEVSEGLKNCESSAQISYNIEQYRVCSSSLFSNGMMSLRALQPKYRSSGATLRNFAIFEVYFLGLVVFLSLENFL